MDHEGTEAPLRPWEWQVPVHSDEEKTYFTGVQTRRGKV